MNLFAATAFVLLSPCFAIPGCEGPPLKREEAIEKAERILVSYLQDDEPNSTRRDFKEPVVQTFPDGAEVEFARVNSPYQGVSIFLDRNGCRSISVGRVGSYVKKIE